MKRLVLVLLASCAVSVAVAADTAAPVNEIMREAVKGWAEDAQTGEDYFSEARLQRIYSQDFAKAYREAAKFPAYDEGDSPFDYDVIVSGQDSCSIKDLNVSAGPDVEGKSDVAVTFDNIDKARLVPDWAALGFGPAQDASGRDERPGKKKTNGSGKAPRAKNRD